VKGQAATLQVEMVCLDELVPSDERYRRLDELVDWSFVRVAAEPYYADDLGRPSVDPIVLVKLLVAAALEGIGSARELLRGAAMRLDLRRFLGYGFAERLPAHQTLSHAQTRRFVDGQPFERLFLRSVALCREHDLLDGTHLSIDGFHAEANAALQSLRASLALVAAEDATEPDGEQPGAPAEPRPQLVEPRAGPTPKRKSSNATAVSLTDPDAKLRGKPGQRPHLVHRGQVAVDPKARCVVACRGEQADGHEGDAAEPLVERARFACPELASLGADQGFAAERVWTALERRGIEPFVPPQRTMLATDGEPKTDAQRQAQRARERCKSERGVWAHKRRMADAEGVIGELKNQGNLARARCRGTPLFHVQLLVGCTAINMKRLTSHAGKATAGGAAAPASGAVTAIDAVDVVAQRSLGDRIAAARAPSARQNARQPARTAIWSFGVSLN
ncbi:MAG: transposase, partial [Actinobacteria bacterium]|nr:transposase [Actinomycetota bacterium]